MENKAKIILFRLFLSLLLLSVLGLIVIFIIELIKINKEDAYLINIIGLVGVAIFLLIEAVMLLKNINKQIIFHALVFNEHNSTINYPAFITANVFLAIGVGLSILGTVLYFTTADETIKTSVMVLIPIGIFVLLNCIGYDVYTLLFKAKKTSLKDLINK